MLRVWGLGTVVPQENMLLEKSRGVMSELDRYRMLSTTFTESLDVE